MSEAKGPYFEFTQNNTGGSFDIDDERGIGPRVWIAADDAGHANYRAQRIGLYWDGVSAGMDCPCCGDRWYEQFSDDNGEPSPSPNQDYDFRWHDTVYVHERDGQIVRLKATPSLRT